MRQRAELLFGRLPMPGPNLYLAQQQLRRLAVRQLAGKLYRLGTAGDEAGDEGLLQQVGIVGMRGEGSQHLGSRRLRIGLRHREAADQEIPEHADRRIAGGAAHEFAGGGIRCGNGGEEGQGEKERAPNASDMLHLHNLLHMTVKVIQI